MTFLSSLLTWANLPFVVALGAALTILLLQVTGFFGLLMGGAEHEGDADHGAHADAHDGADGDHGADADHDADHPGGGAAGNVFLAGIGVGTMPLSLVWQAFAICFGLAGIAANSVVLRRTGALPTGTLAWTVPVAALFGFAVNHGLSRLFARLVVPPHQAATSRKDLVGCTGVVISSRVDREFGEVRTVDRAGDTLRLIVKTLDRDEIIAEGREVVFVEYDAEKDTLYVAPFDDAAPHVRRRIAVGAKARVPLEPTPARPPPEAAEVTDASAAPQDRETKTAS